MTIRVHTFHRMSTGLVAMAIGLAGTFPSAHARPWDEIAASNEITVCANPNALPYASDKPSEPGFQIEIARAIAGKLGVKLRPIWIIPRHRAGMFDCDLLMDSIVRDSIHPPSLKLSMPYHQSGVSLAFGAAEEPASTYRDLKPRTRVGAMMNSYASVVLGKAGAIPVFFGTEDDMMEALAKGEIQAAAVTAASAGYFNKQRGGNLLKIARAEDSEPDLKWSVAIGMRRSDAALIEKVNAVLGDLLASGEVAAIYANCGVEHRVPAGR
ncbi:MAG: substrate-binding periplasmic protein [Burkholderiales bacterium]